MTTELAPLPTFDAIPRRFQTVTVSHDGHAPALRCGECAIIDTAAKEPEDGTFVFYRSESTDLRGERQTHEAIVRLSVFGPDAFKRSPEKIREEGRLWSLGYRKVNWPNLGVVYSGDGPIPDKLLQLNIVGRVVGVWRPI